MTTLFYLFGILAILWEFAVLTDTNKIHYFLGNKEKNKDNDNYTNLSFLMLGYFLWAIVGLFSSQWILFLVLIVLSIIPTKHIVLRWIDSLLSLLILLFILINKFHLHIDILSLLQ